MSDYEKCPICGKEFWGLMAFASHTAAEHGLSAIQVWRKELWDKLWNPSSRNPIIRTIGMYTRRRKK